ncbi:MAG TPA: hypothetical protein DHW82_08785 [Spirochaetia bacterium]|nr:MAG: hypothetical protein A2Y41_05135 [Spirochaetes bacterium GWB1_36_13]HCL57086.1 hypothetical protein [Spirochaetia bacterium]
MASKIIGKWQITVGVLAGFSYEFRENGSFNGELPMYNVKFSGTFKTNESVTPHEIDIQVTEHTYGDGGKGEVLGIFELDGDTLKMKLNEPGKPRWTDINAYYYYQKS